MPPAPPVTIRTRAALVHHANRTDRLQQLVDAEATRWRMFGDITAQHVDGDTLTTTVQPRGTGGALAIHRAVEVSDHHVLAEGATP